MNDAEITFLCVIRCLFNCPEIQQTILSLNYMKNEILSNSFEFIQQESILYENALIFVKEIKVLFQQMKQSNHDLAQFKKCFDIFFM